MVSIVTHKEKGLTSNFVSYEQGGKLVKIHNYGHHKTPKNHIFGPAIRPYFLIHLIKKGEGVFEKNGVKTFLSEGDAFIIRPDEITVYSSSNENPWEYYWISFFGENAENLLNSTTTKSFCKSKKSALLGLMDAIDNTVNDEIGLLKLLFTVLDGIKDEQKEKQEDFIKLAINYIESNYFRDFNASILADILKISRSYFTTTFTKKTGESPYNYLLKTRVKNAKHYLKNTTLSVTEIAFSVGFNSIERFSEIFKRFTGLSPNAYRKSENDYE
ncbi:MAG: AraC family transcriptional regulator [Clostridia bacterium]|nr:AraC family transcriptional regulator [Clostridia bacterium]